MSSNSPPIANNKKLSKSKGQVAQVARGVAAGHDDLLLRVAGGGQLAATTTMIKEIYREYDIDFEADAICDVVAVYLAGEAPPDVEAERAKERAAAGETGGPGAGRGPGEGKPEDHEGEPPPVRGNMTINEIVLKTGIPGNYLPKESGLPEDVPTRLALREFLHKYDVTPRDSRDVVDKYRTENR